MCFGRKATKPSKNALTVEIMTPHYGDYYQAKTSSVYPNGATPHDAGQPNPIPFLALPADSSLDFHVVCESHYLPDALRSRWEPLLEQILTHAFDWLGFGAKTAVGYGVMERDLKEKDKRLARMRKDEELKAYEQELQDATAGLPEDAAWVAQKAVGNAWPEPPNSSAFLDDATGYLAARETLSPEGYAKFRGVIERRWPGIMTNPDAVQGKKQKPRFSDRQKALAKRLLELKPKQDTQT